MKYIYIFLLAVALTGLAAPLFANSMKVTILHCGCAYDEVDGPSLRFVEIDVNRKARGHSEHGVGSIVSCYAGTDEVAKGQFEDQYRDFVHMADDCQLSGGKPMRESIAQCDWMDEPQPEPGDTCGEEPWY